MSRYPMRPIAPKTKRRRVLLGPAEVRLLDDWGRALRSAFPHGSVYHVGSSFTGTTYRDVDVRIMLADDQFDTLAGVIKPRRLNLMLTLWGRQVTGLPIDCQIQRTSDANRQYPHPRNPLGLRGDEGNEGA